MFDCSYGSFFDPKVNMVLLYRSLVKWTSSLTLAYKSGIEQKNPKQASLWKLKMYPPRLKVLHYLFKMHIFVKHMPVALTSRYPWRIFYQWNLQSCEKFSESLWWFFHARVRNVLQMSCSDWRSHNASIPPSLQREKIVPVIRPEIKQNGTRQSVSLT